MLSPELARKIKAAFDAGELRVRSVDPSSGGLQKSVVTAVLRHSSEQKPCVKVTAKGAHVVVTEDHSLFLQQGEGIVPVPAGDLSEENAIATYDPTCGKVQFSQVEGVEPAPPRLFMYDLSVPGPENFVLSNGLVAHNSYSIGGISLDIDRSSKYESLKNNAEQMVDKAAETKLATTKIVRGLSQPRFGVGVRSSFGPAVGRGVLSPRNFVGL